MAVTKIHPILKTLYSALEYIMNEEKTDDKILISSFACDPQNAHLEFEQTKKEVNSKAKVLARHLIQSFAPGECTPELAHQIGLELCQKVLNEKYEFVLTTHIDKGHIHNHIIFNNVSFESGKAYRSNKRSYHEIRDVSDALCAENNLSVIDESYRKYKTMRLNTKSYKEYMEFKKGNSWKNKLQLAIDKSILKSKNYEDFLKSMEEFGYEIKVGKYLSFRHKSQGSTGRFTRTKEKVLGKDYTKERILERIVSADKSIARAEKGLYQKASSSKLDNIIDLKNNNKVNESKAYEIWAGKHNMNAAAATLNAIREKGINSYTDLDNYLKNIAQKRQSLLGEIKSVEDKMNSISSTIECSNTLSQNKLIYDTYLADVNDKAFYAEYKQQISLYEMSLKQLKESNFNNYKIEDLLNLYGDLKMKKESLMELYSEQTSSLHELQHAKKNIGLYLNNDLEK